MRHVATWLHTIPWQHAFRFLGGIFGDKCREHPLYGSGIVCFCYAMEIGDFLVQGGLKILQASESVPIPFAVALEHLDFVMDGSANVLTLGDEFLIYLFPGS